jgi:hypothetical protein
MTPELFKRTEAMMRDAEEMRAFYQSVGLSAETIERAIAAKHERHPSPVPEDERPMKGRGRKKKLAV